MSFYRTMYYGDVKVGAGGRITIPQEMRDDLGLEQRKHDMPASEDQ